MAISKESQEVAELRKVVLQLAEAQRQTEQHLDTLVLRVDQLAERMDQLAEAQRRTEKQIQILAKAQQRTEAEVRKLGEVFQDLATQVGRLSETVGFGLEDIARVMLPAYLQRHLDIQIDDLERNFLGPPGRQIEINLFGEGTRKGEKIFLLGEAKSRIYQRDVEKFCERLDSVKDYLPRGEMIRVMFGYFIHPSATEMAKEKGILLVASYQR